MHYYYYYYYYDAFRPIKQKNLKVVAVKVFNIMRLFLTG